MTGNDSRHSALTRRRFLERGVGFGFGLSALAVGLDRLADTALAPELLPRDSGCATIDGDEFSLANAAIDAAWSTAGGTLRAVRITDRLHHASVPVAERLFALTLADGSTITPAELTIVSGPRVERIAVNARASRLATRIPARQVTVALRDCAGRLDATWRAILGDGAQYIRQELTLRSTGAPVPIREIALVDLHAPGAAVSGIVKGSPVVAGHVVYGFEHPLSESVVDGDRVRCHLARELPLRPGAPITYSSMVLVTHSGQLRRDMLAYLERERAHPYRTFLHYNSWYDIGYFSQYNEADALGAITAFGTELARKRNVILNSFLFDDGWDDPKTLWHFNAGFPDGFTRVRHAAARYGAAPGVWMSPWGGYGKPREKRLAYGRAQGFETNAGGFVLSGPRYFRRFRETCLEMIHRYGVNQFKFDGTGNASSGYPGSAFDSDFDAAISLIEELRAAQGDLYVNLTTGTYPSPFWLRYADSIWRGGDDHSFAGVGTNRQQWITYRDADTYANVVRRGPLYPLNSLMLHGLIYARHANKLDTDPHGDFRSEIRAYFGSGTQLQEMYITPALLTTQNWDDLAEAARWSRAHAGTLVDTHWVGGDPARLEVYGWASWSPRAGILVLRNPSDRAQMFDIDVRQAFELPAEAPHAYATRSPWRDAGASAPAVLRAGEARTVHLAPFEVLTLDLTPSSSPSPSSR